MKPFTDSAVHYNLDRACLSNNFSHKLDDIDRSINRKTKSLLF